MEISAFETPFWRSLTYLLVQGEHAILIDPCELEPVIQLIESKKLHLDYAILTHEHCDHITGVSWAQALGANVLTSSVCASRLQDPKLNGAYYFNSFSEIQEKLACGRAPIPQDFVCHASSTFEQEKTFAWQGHTVLLKSTPGHTPGSICALFDDSILFCGDTLLENTSTNTRFPGGNKKQFASVTLPWLHSLPGDIQVYPGHFNTFSLAEHLNSME